ncbi:MAG TPA: HlyD family efflux transporter periplasmic adaptor subunit [Caulobacteraceae bacterium]|nr:HlyD family efflux transporter periplasmic adaptor subunit [Caulobacteraceae bacterium]
MTARFTPIATLACLAMLAGLAPLAACKGAADATTTNQAVAPASTPYAAIADGKADVEGGIIQVAARTQGVIRDVFVQEGDEVKKGQVLARQEDDVPRLAADTAAANLAQAEAQIAVSQSQLDAAQREANRLRPLIAAHYASTQSLDQAEDAVRGDDATLAAQRAEIAVAQTQLAQARYAEELTVIRAPIDGRIVRRYANPGVGASTLNVTSMFDLEPDTRHIVRAEVAESSEPYVFVGQTANLYAEVDQTRAYPGKVLRIAPVFGARKLQSDDPSQQSDERVVEVVVSADTAPFLIGQRVLVKFMKSGH